MAAKKTGQLKPVSIHLKVDPDDKDWHETRARKSGLTVSDYVRELLLKERLSVELEPAEAPEKKLTLREQYLADIQENGAPLQAAQRLGVTPGKVAQWAKTGDLAKEVALARAMYLESLEQEMANIGRGRKKGDTQAIGWLLNAHHPSHGRAKKELILSMVNPLVNKLMEFVSRELGPDVHDRLKKAVAEFQIEVRKKLVGLS